MCSFSKLFAGRSTMNAIGIPSSGISAVCSCSLKASLYPRPVVTLMSGLQLQGINLGEV